MSPKEPVPTVWEGLPVVDSARMRALDFDATARFSIPAAALMENAGRAVARETVAFLKGKGIEPASAKVVVCCGRGANGGDGLVAARHLRQEGVGVLVFLCPAKKDSGYPELVRGVLASAAKAGVEVRPAGPEAGLSAALAACDAALDALLGTGSSGKPAGAIHHMLSEINKAKKPVVAVDVPTGLHPDTGYHSGAYLTAELTLTLGLPKKGLLAAHAKPFVGTLKILDIGYPAELVQELLPR
ncbi:MAG: NAD(P)H-hydrate epimerase [Elusimicrobia bacterium RIFOXYD12_FULL_66_9]|nr:MAG: NAD(P)H-hydrate epimerase [Elusimicrobia bacterium RIFOXYD12_FULL_66_9]